MSNVIIWEWFDKKKWVAYDSATNQILEQAFNAGQGKLILDHGFFSSGPYTIDFKKMTQTNNQTGFSRLLRRNPGEMTESVACWACLVKKKYEPYDSETSRLLEESYQSGSQKLVLEQGASKASYIIDFVEMKQMNKKTGYVREIRRYVDKKKTIKASDKSNDEKHGRSIVQLSYSAIPQIPQQKLKPCCGDIIVTLKAGREFAEVSPFGLSPFVVVTTDFSPFVIKSEWRFRTSLPVWNQHFVIPVSRYDMEGHIFFTLYHYHQFSKNDYLGRLDIELYDVITNMDTQGWMPLTYESKKKSKRQPPGQLELSLQWAAKPFPQGTKLDLNFILKAEDMVAHQEKARAASLRPTNFPDSNTGTQNTTTTTTTTTTSGAVTNLGIAHQTIVKFADPDIVEGVVGKYKLGDVLGEGGFALVKRGTNIQTNGKVAVKIIQKMIQADADAVLLITREIQILHLIENQSCVSFIESLETSENIYIVMEFVGGGDLLDAILDAGGFDEKRSAKAIRDILRGLDYLHQTGICHRDMKPENVLYHPELDVWKITDFGCSTLFSENDPFMTEFEGTIQYMAPEILVGEKYTKSIDLWATGVITYVSLSACFPWEGKTDAEVQESIMNYKIKFYYPEFQAVSQSGIDFIMRLMEMSTEKRLAVDGALAHAWLNQN